MKVVHIDTKKEQKDLYKNIESLYQRYLLQTIAKEEKESSKRFVISQDWVKKQKRRSSRSVKQLFQSFTGKKAA